MVLGATLIALTPAVFMFLFSFLLMTGRLTVGSRRRRRSCARTRRGCAGVGGVCRQQCAGEAESIAASGAADLGKQAQQDVLAAHRVTLQGGFVVIYDRSRQVVASFEAPPAASDASLVPWQDQGNREAAAIHGPLSAILLTAARRSDVYGDGRGGQEYAAACRSHPPAKWWWQPCRCPGTEPDHGAHPVRAAAYWQLFRARNGIRTIFFLMQLLITVFIFFSSLWLAMFLSKQITRPVEALGVAMDEIATGKYDHRVAEIASGEMETWCGRSTTWRRILRRAGTWRRALQHS